MTSHAGWSGTAETPSLRTERATLGRLALLLLAMLPLLAGCESAGTDEASESIPVEEPDHRSDMSLFDDPARIEVLQMQAARDVVGLIDRLDHSEGPVRARAAFALASARDAAAAGPLRTVLETDPDPAVRREAAFALGHLPTEDEGQGLMEAFRSEEDGGVRTALLETLGLRGGNALLDSLAAMEPDPDAHPAHALALSRLALRATADVSPEALDRLIGLLSHDDAAVREGAAYYFGRLVDPAPWTEHAGAVRDALDGLDRADPAAMHLLLGLGRLRDRDDAERLIDWMARAEDWRIRLNAVRAAGTTQLLETPGVREALWERVESDPYEHVAITAANSLLSGFRVPLSVQTRAAEWVNSGPDRWRTKIPFLEYRGMLGEGEEVLAWVNEYGDHSAEIARSVPELLVASQLPEALRMIDEYTQHEDLRVRVAAIRTLAERWEFGNPGDEEQQEYFDRFEEALFDAHPWVASQAAGGLATPTFHPFGAVQVLQTAWEERRAGDLDEEWPVLHAILDALGQIGDPEALPLIERALEDPDFRIRQAAGEAHEAMTGQEVRGLEIPDPGIGLDPAYLAALGSEPRLVLRTDRGTVGVRLVPGGAPLTVQAVAQWAEAGRYDGTIFHRVIGNFVTQGGDFSVGDGSGGPGLELRTEVTGIPFRRGVVGMASGGHDTEGSQFFLTHSMQPHLDGSEAEDGSWQAFTSFGWIDEGESVLDRLMEGDRIIEARVERGTDEER